ncbi:MAG: hypothetical protein ACKO6N_10335 [Myxococcota bacterium]
MPKVLTDQPSTYWQALIIEILRVAVYVALRSNQGSGKNLVRLLQVAMFRELEAEHRTQREMSIQLEYSEGAVKLLAQASRTLQKEAASVQQGAILRKLITVLESGAQTERALLEAFNKSTELEDIQIGLTLLEARRLIRREGSHHLRYQLASSDLKDWQKPLSELEQEYLLHLHIMQRLHARPMSAEQLLKSPELKVLGLERLQAQLVFLQRAGYLEVTEARRRVPARWSSRPGVHSLVLSHPKERFRAGHLDLFRKIRDYMKSVLDRPERKLGQRAVIARISKADLATFIPWHRDVTVQELDRLEAQAAAREDGEEVVMFWGIAPLQQVEQ